MECWNIGIVGFNPSFHYSINPDRNNASVEFLTGFIPQRFTFLNLKTPPKTEN